MRHLFPLTFVHHAGRVCRQRSGGPVLPGLVNAPPPPIAGEDSLPLGVVWSWQMTRMSDGAVIVPDGRERYTVEFRPGGTVSVRADCNRGQREPTCAAEARSASDRSP
jgi:hypothetical protein